MAALGFRSPQDPGLPLGVGEDSGRARCSSDNDRGARPPGSSRRAAPGARRPWRADGRRRRPAAARPHPRPAPACADQRAGRRDEDGIQAVGPGVGKDMVHRPIGQRRRRSRRGRSADRQRPPGSTSGARCRGSSAAARARSSGKRRDQPGGSAREAGTCCGPRAAAVRASRSAQAPSWRWPSRTRCARPTPQPAAAAGSRARQQSPHCRPCRSRLRR